MKTRYKIIYTIQDGDHKEPGEIIVHGLSQPPSLPVCVELTMRAFYPNAQAFVAMDFYMENGYVPHPDHKRTITHVDYALDIPEPVEKS